MPNVISLEVLGLKAKTLQSQSWLFGGISHPTKKSPSPKIPDSLDENSHPEKIPDPRYENP